MITSNHDNQKYPLVNQVANVINNNSKVTIYQNCKLSYQDASGLNTITINKGNTVSLLARDEYTTDVVYGNSKLKTQNDFFGPKHESLVDYNFPTSIYKVNGWKTCWGVLLNNGVEPYWTIASKGVLLGDLDDVEDVNLIPTRMNRFTATVIASPRHLYLENKYNGDVVINVTDKTNLGLLIEYDCCYPLTSINWYPVEHVHVNTSAPSNPWKGQFFYNTDKQTLQQWDGYNWISVECNTDKKFLTIPSDVKYFFNNTDNTTETPLSTCYFGWGYIGTKENPAVENLNLTPLQNTIMFHPTDSATLPDQKCPLWYDEYNNNVVSYTLDGVDYYYREDKNVWKSIELGGLILNSLSATGETFRYSPDFSKYPTQDCPVYKYLNNTYIMFRNPASKMFRKQVWSSTYVGSPPTLTPIENNTIRFFPDPSQPPKECQLYKDENGNVYVGYAINYGTETEPNIVTYYYTSLVETWQYVDATFLTLTDESMEFSPDPNDLITPVHNCPLYIDQDFNEKYICYTINGTKNFYKIAKPNPVYVNVEASYPSIILLTNCDKSVEFTPDANAYQKKSCFLFEDIHGYVYACYDSKKLYYKLYEKVWTYIGTNKNLEPQKYYYTFGTEGDLNLPARVCQLYEDADHNIYLFYKITTSFHSDHVDNIIFKNFPYQSDSVIKNSNYIEVDSFINGFGTHISPSITLDNVRYGYFKVGANVINLTNSNILIQQFNDANRYSQNLLLYVGKNSYITVDARSDSYLNYILSGIDYTSTYYIHEDNINRNIFLKQDRVEKQTLHAYSDTAGYNSNLPVGSIVWWPEVWTSFKSQYDKNSDQYHRRIYMAGEPFSDDWKICNGEAIPTGCLYSQIYANDEYDALSAPDYRVREEIANNNTSEIGIHYGNQESLVKVLPSSVLHIKPISAGCLNTTRTVNVSQNSAKDDTLLDGKNVSLSCRQNLLGDCDLQLQIKANYRAQAWVAVQFELNVKELRRLGLTDQQIKNTKIKFDSYCCGPHHNWWKAWNGGDIEAYSNETSTLLPIQEDGTLDGFPSSDVIADGKWINTRNTPKLSLLKRAYRVEGVEHPDIHGSKVECISGNSLQPFTDSSINLRASMNYNIQEYDGVYHIQTTNLPYLLKTYQLTFSGYVGTTLPDTLTTSMLFAIGLPTVERNGIVRWAGYKDRDENNSQYWQADWISVFNNVRINLFNMDIDSTTHTTITENKDQITNISTYFNWGTGYKEKWGAWQDISTNAPLGPNMKPIDIVQASGWTWDNQGLYRRLVPWIKIDSNNTVNPPEKLYQPNYALNKVKVNAIKVRYNFNSKQQKLITNNKATENLAISAFYYLDDDFSDLLDNVIDFNCEIIQSQLDELTVMDARVRYEENDIFPFECKVYKDLINNVYYIVLNEAHVDDLFKGYNKDFTINDLAIYHSSNWLTNVDTLVPIKYSYYNVQKRGDMYIIKLNKQLIKIAANNKILENVVRYLDNQTFNIGDNYYLNTSPHNLPIFFTDEDRNGKIGTNEKKNIFNEGTALTTYYLLGSQYMVLSALLPVSSYYFNINYDLSDQKKIYIDNGSIMSTVVQIIDTETYDEPVINSQIVQLFGTTLKQGHYYITTKVEVTPDPPEVGEGEQPPTPPEPVFVEQQQEVIVPLLPQEYVISAKFNTPLPANTADVENGTVSGVNDIIYERLRNYVSRLQQDINQFQTLDRLNLLEYENYKAHLNTLTPGTISNNDNVHAIVDF